MRTSISSWSPTACSRCVTCTTMDCDSAISASRAKTCSSPLQGDGLTIAYHGLNLGRVALVRDGGGLDARDAGQHAALGPVPPDLRRGHRLARAGPAADRPAWPR